MGSIGLKRQTEREQRAEELALISNPNPKSRHRRVTPWEIRFWDKVEHRPDGCMVWTGATNKAGYAWFNPGPIRANRKPVLGHRWLYESLNGAVPDGLVLDHLCRVRNCVNPEHLDPVTTQVNTNRGDSSLQWECPNGHRIFGGNEYRAPSFKGHRCKTCSLEKERGNGAYRVLLPHDVESIIGLREQGLLHTEIASKVGCSKASVSRVLSGYRTSFMVNGYAAAPS